MASKRRQSENGKTEKRKKKSCEETPQLCSVVKDEQVKAAVKEAWDQRTSYTQGWWTNVPPLTTEFTVRKSDPDVVFRFGLRFSVLTREVRIKHPVYPNSTYNLCKRFFSFDNISLIIYWVQEIWSWTVTLSPTASSGIFSVATPSLKASKVNWWGSTFMRNQMISTNLNRCLADCAPDMSQSYGLKSCHDFFFFLPCCCSYTVRWLEEENRAAHCWTKVMKNAIEDDCIIRLHLH